MKSVVTVLLGLMFVVADGSVFAQAPQGAPAAGQGRGDTQGQAQGRQGGGRGRGPAAPACANLACDVALDWTRTAALLTTMVDAMPADKFGFKPTDAQQTFAERVVHIAQTDLRLLGSLGAKTPPPTINAKATSKADVLAALKASFTWGEAVVKEFNDAQLVERITPLAFLGPSASRVRVIYYSLQHTQDIYGQLVVYLRLNGVTPPASNRGI
jgi:uncharacterized damage-inducible protein DinB